MNFTDSETFDIAWSLLAITAVARGSKHVVTAVEAQHIKKFITHLKLHNELAINNQNPDLVKFFAIFEKEMENDSPVKPR